MLASVLLLVVFISLIVWGLVSLFRGLVGDSPYAAPEAPVAEVHPDEQEQRSPGMTSGNS
jgi:hypothetical protein